MVDIELNDIIQLLSRLIETPSTSGNEEHSADLLQDFLTNRSIMVERKLNNIVVRNKYFNPERGSVFLNSHHDTVKPSDKWETDPYQAIKKDDQIIGLGSNDAGGAVVSLLDVFIHYFDRNDLKMNVILALSAEEEISGKNGIIAVLPDLENIEYGIVGEPTGMKMAIAEKGLMVLDCIVHGQSGHAARNEGENAIYNALPDIEWFRKFKFPKISEMLGTVKMSVTVIHAGKQHNSIPDRCEFTVDLRSTDAYTHDEILKIIRSNVDCEVKPRSLRLKPSGLPAGHILLEAGQKSGLPFYGSDALSDQALMDFPTVKIGPGDPSRSHKAGEFISINEIREGIRIYKSLLNHLLF